MISNRSHPPTAGKKKKGKAGEGVLRSQDDTVTRIVKEATRLFAASGFDAVSIKEICTAANVNLAAIHYHFDSKENLYQHILGQFASGRLDMARKTLTSPRNLEEFKVRLEIFLSESLACFPEQSEVITILHREMESKVPCGTSEFVKTMDEHFRVLLDFFHQAKNNQILAEEINPFFVATSLIGQFLFLAKKEHHLKALTGFSLTDPKARTEWVNHAIWLLVNGARKRDSL